MVYGAILAGGQGIRLGGDVPKQFQLIGGKPILFYSVKKFIQCSRIDRILIGVHPNWLQDCRRLLNHYFADSSITLVPGGQDRNATIQNVISHIQKHDEIQKEDLLITHDAVRPFLTMRNINEIIDATIECGASDTVVPAVDTIVASSNKIYIDTVPRREYLYMGQSPQGFNLSLMQKVYAQTDSAVLSSMTDACSVFVRQGYRVKLVSGDQQNFKITTPFDLKVADTLALREQETEPVFQIQPASF